MEQTKTLSSRENGFPGSTIKLFAIITMFIDHIGAVIIERYISVANVDTIIYNSDITEWFPRYGLVYIADLIFRSIGRMGFPLFIFLLVEGFVHTRNRVKYIARLAVFAIISEVPFNLAIANKAYDEGYQSVFFTLLLGFLFMCWDDYLKNKVFSKLVGILSLAVSSVALAFWVYIRFFGNPLVISSEKLPGTVIFGGIFVVLIVIAQCRYGKNVGAFNLRRLSVSLIGLAVLMFMADILKTDYAGLGVLAIAAAYAYRDNKKKSIGYCCAVLTIFNFFEVFSFFDVAIVSRYNGKKGMGLKYVFYAFYPVHLLLLHILTYLLGIVSGNWWGF